MPGGDSIDITSLRAGFVGKKYAQLVEHHVRRQSKQQLIASVIGTSALLPEPVRALASDAVEEWNLRAYDAAFWQRDCAKVFDEILADMAARLDHIGIPPGDEMLFNMFQVITTSYAYNASDQKSMREFMGIRKGFFQR